MYNYYGDWAEPPHYVTERVIALNIDTSLGSMPVCYDVITNKSVYWCNTTIGRTISPNTTYTFHVTNHYSNKLLWIDEVIQV